MNKPLAIATLFLAAACSACHDVPFGRFEDLPRSGWAASDTLTFSPDTLEKAFPGEGTLMLSVRHDNSFEFSELWLSIEYCDGNEEKTDTLDVALCDIYGNWYGRGLGIIFQKTDTVARGVRLAKDKPVKVSHLMRGDKPLGGIEQIGIIYSGK